MAGPAGLGQIQFKPHTIHIPWQVATAITPKQCKSAPWVEVLKVFEGVSSKKGSVRRGNCCKRCLLASCTRPRWVHYWASTWSEPQFSEYWNWSLAAATAALGFHTPVSPSAGLCPPQPAREPSVGRTTHRGSSCSEFRSCFTSIRKAAISSKFLAWDKLAVMMIRCLKAFIQMKWSETVVGLFTFAFAHFCLESSSIGDLLTFLGDWSLCELKIKFQH